MALLAFVMGSLYRIWELKDLISIVSQSKNLNSSRALLRFVLHVVSGIMRLRSIIVPPGKGRSRAVLFVRHATRCKRSPVSYIVSFLT